MPEASTRADCFHRDATVVHRCLRTPAARVPGRRCTNCRPAQQFGGYAAREVIAHDAHPLQVRQVHPATAVADPTTRCPAATGWSSSSADPDRPAPDPSIRFVQVQMLQGGQIAQAARYRPAQVVVIEVQPRQFGVWCLRLCFVGRVCAQLCHFWPSGPCRRSWCNC